MIKGRYFLIDGVSWEDACHKLGESIEPSFVAWEESKFFEFLEEKVHPRVFFCEVNLSVQEEKVILSGQTDSFLTLQQQLSVLNKESIIEDLVLTKAALNKEGGIDFNLDIFLNKEIFKY